MNKITCEPKDESCSWGQRCRSNTHSFGTVSLLSRTILQCHGFKCKFPPKPLFWSQQVTGQFRRAGMGLDAGRGWTRGGAGVPLGDAKGSSGFFCPGLWSGVVIYTPSLAISRPRFGPHPPGRKPACPSPHPLLPRPGFARVTEAKSAFINYTLPTPIQTPARVC